MKILSIASARPNFVKLAAVHHALKGRPNIEHVIIHTGQHYDPLLSDVFFTQLNIDQPKQNLGIHGGAREDVIQKTTDALLPVLETEKPDWVVVYGDVNGAVGGAQAAHACGIKLAHVEAGLRSFDPEMPEEHNRITIDQLADLLLCSEQSGVQNLQKEQVKGQIEHVGNTMIDTLRKMMPLIEKEALPIVMKENSAILTLHRPSNVDSRDALTRNLRFLEDISTNIRVIMPLHHRTEAAINRFHLSLPANVLNVGPMPYIAFLRLVKAASFILTDSGGIQEEAVLLGKRCFTLRKNTERPATIDSGSNVLIDIDKPDDRQAVLEFAAHPQDPDVTIPELWDGKAGERIADLLLA